MRATARSDTQVGANARDIPQLSANNPEPEYRLTFVDSALPPLSLFRQIWQSLHEPKVTVPKEYYRGEVSLPATDMRPWFLDLPSQLRALFEKPKPPSIQITSQPVDVPNMWQDYQPESGSWMNSVLVHLVGVAIILLPILISKVRTSPKVSVRSIVIDYPRNLAEIGAAGTKMRGGGGGGDRSSTPASKGAVPPFSTTQVASPMAVIRNLHPILQVEPTLLGPPELKVPQMDSIFPNWGDPAGVRGPLSNGPGCCSGIGSGTGTGIGPGDGAGLGLGKTAGFGGETYSVGGDIGAPIPIFKPEPPYSEEARKAKYQGTVVLMIVVDAQGNVTDCQVVRPLGLGLDEKATETVRTWKFKPAMRNLIPVPVRVVVEVSFRLF